MSRDGFLADGQANAGAFVLRHAMQAFERFENLRRVFRRDPNAIVAYTERPHVTGLVQGELNHRGIVSNKFERITNQVLIYLCQQRRIARVRDPGCPVG